MQGSPRQADPNHVVPNDHLVSLFSPLSVMGSLDAEDLLQDSHRPKTAKMAGPFGWEGALTSVQKGRLQHGLSALIVGYSNIM